MMILVYVACLSLDVPMLKFDRTNCFGVLYLATVCDGLRNALCPNRHDDLAGQTITLRW